MDNTNRDRIRALVRDVLDNALPEETPSSSAPAGTFQSFYRYRSSQFHQFARHA